MAGFGVGDTCLPPRQAGDQQRLIVISPPMPGGSARRHADHGESLAAATEMGHDVLVAQALGQLAIVDILDGQLDDARVRLRAQVDHLRRARNLEGLANALDTVAAAAVAGNGGRLPRGRLLPPPICATAPASHRGR
jgi:hypothetical protein